MPSQFSQSPEDINQLYDRLRKEHPTLPQGYLNASRAARSAKDYDTALALLNDYRSQAKTFQQTFDIELNVFQILLAKKNFQAAINWLKDLEKSGVFFSALPQGFYNSLSSCLTEYFLQKQDTDVDESIRLILRLMLHQCLPVKTYLVIMDSLSLHLLRSMPRSANSEQSRTLYENIRNELPEIINTFTQTAGINDTVEYISIYYNFISDTEEKRRLYFKIFDQFPLMWGRILLGEGRPLLVQDQQYFSEWATDRFNHQLTTLSPDRIFNACQIAWTVNQDLYLDMVKKAVEAYADKELPAPIFGLKQILTHRVAGLGRSKRYRVVNDKVPLRIAVCISGQLRGFREAFPTWKKMQLESQGHQIDYFIHTWKKVGGITYSWRRLPRIFRGSILQAVRQSLPLDVQINLKDFYPHFYRAALGTHEEIDDVTLSDFYGAKKVVVEDETSEKIKALAFPGLLRKNINFSKMFYGMEESFKLLEGHEDDYDLVIRMRPDLFIDNWKVTDWHAVYKDSVENYRVFLDSRQRFRSHSLGTPGRLLVGDLFAIGTYGVMQQYTSVLAHYFSNRQSEVHKFGSSFTLSAHESLADHLFYGGLLGKGYPQKIELVQPFARITTLHEALLKDMAKRSLPYDTALLEAIQKDLAEEVSKKNKKKVQHMSLYSWLRRCLKIF